MTNRSRGPCAIEGCPKEATATIYCQMHYRRFRLYGDPNFTQNKQRRHFEKSNIKYCETHVEVELTQGKIALIDFDDVVLVADKAWHFSASTGYAYWQQESMQQLLLGKAPHGFEIDHENRNKLDNRRKNISFQTNRDNAINSERSDNKKSVAYHRASGKYQAYIVVTKYIQIYLGLYLTEELGKQALKRAEKLYGECNMDIPRFKTAWKLMRLEKADTEKRDE